MNLSLSIADIEQGALLGTLLVTYLGGLLTAFTPCVYPLIPVTLGIMGVRSGSSRIRSIYFSLTFVGGLAAVYAGLGFFAATTGSLMGSVTQQPFTVGLVALLFTAMGLSLLGLFNFQLPSSINTWLAKRGGNGFAGTLTLGAVSGILAAPCAGPVIVGILAYVGQKSNPALGAGLLLLYSVGIGTPFVVLAFSAQQISKIPRAGVWTVWIKSVCGVALIVAAILFAKPFLPARTLDLIIALSLLAFGIFLKKIFPTNSGESAPFHHWVRIVTGLGLMLFLFIPSTPPAAPVVHSNSELAWLSSEPEGLKKALSEGKPAIIDFWAEWCEACKQLDEETYTDSKVKASLARDFILIKVDATNITDAQKVLQKYDVSALPTILFLEPSGNVLRKETVTGFLPPPDFQAVLSKVLSQINKKAT